MLDINTVLRATPDCETLFPGFARLVTVTADGDASLIRLDIYPLKAPFNLPLSALIEAVQAGRILNNQIYDIGLHISKDQLSQAARHRLEKNINLIKPLLEDERLLSDSESRGREFAVRALECGVNVRLIRRLYYQYLWCGQTVLSFAPHFHKSGGRGKPQKEGSARRGRRSIKREESSEVALHEVREKIEKGVRRFYLSGRYTLKESYILTLKQYFSGGARPDKGSDNKIKLEEILLPNPKLPTIRQFRYVCELIEKQVGKRIKLPRQVRAKAPIWTFRGKARQGVPGPGYRFEIDATKLQIQLVSRYGRANIVGSPTLYIIVDVWSGAIAGYALSLENASWALAAKALHNCFHDKGTLFKRLDLPYESVDWPCHHLPTCLAADRAELIGDKASMVSEVGIKVEIMPPMCPERKGKVESTINAVKHGHFYHLPGSHPKFLKRRESDGKNSAAITIVELELIIVEAIMDLNNDPVPIESIPQEMLKDDKPNVSHIGLYSWGLKHRPGFTRTMSQKDIYTNLLTKAEASVTARGIYFKGQTYVCPHLHERGNLAHAADGGRYKIEIRYDEHIADQVWFFDNISNEWVTAINDNEEIQRLKSAFYEIESFRQDAQQLIRETKAENIHQRDNKDKRLTQIVQDAKEQAEATKKGQTKSKNKKAIRFNRSVEKETSRLILEKQTIASYPVAVLAVRETEKKRLKQDSACESSIQAEQSKKSITQRSKELWRDSK